MLGVIKLARGQPREALKLMGSALRIKAPSPQILLNYGLVLNALNRYLEALENFDLAIKRKSKYSDARINRGAVLGRDEEALASCRKVIAIEPRNVEAHSGSLATFASFTIFS